MSGPDPAGLLDTSVVIDLGRLTPADLPQESFISAVTLAELSVGPLVAVTDAERGARVAVLQATEAMFDPLPFDSPSARAFGRVAAGLRTSGRPVRARAYDALTPPLRYVTNCPCTRATRPMSRASLASSSARSARPADE